MSVMRVCCVVHSIILKTMNGICISLKISMSCCSKITDVAIDKMLRPKTRDVSSSDTTNLNDEPADKDQGGLVQPKFRHYYIENRFHELGIEDQSRNIVEMIFRASSANPGRCSRKIVRVLKVNNSRHILARFEKHRETVTLSSYKNRIRHPRSIVDGNEVLRFYGTTMSCCGKKKEKLSQLCRNPCCRVCGIVESGFNTCYNKENGIRLSMNSEYLSEDKSAFSKVKKAKRAVIVCRAIAGRVAGMGRGECEQDDESVGNGLCAKPEILTLWNSDAILPCFVLVFD